MKRTTLAFTIALGLLGTSCSDDAVGVGPYPAASTPAITPTRTLTDSKGLEYLVDDTAHCVQIAVGDGTFTDCVDFTNAGPEGLWRSGDQVVSLLLVGEAPQSAVPGERLVANWYTPAHAERPDRVDAIELKTGVFAIAYRSAVDEPIWGAQVRGPDGRLVQTIPVVGQFLNAPR